MTNSYYFLNLLSSQQSLFLIFPDTLSARTEDPNSLFLDLQVTFSMYLLRLYNFCVI